MVAGPRLSLELHCPNVETLELVTQRVVLMSETAVFMLQLRILLFQCLDGGFVGVGGVERGRFMSRYQLNLALELSFDLVVLTSSHLAVLDQSVQFSSCLCQLRLGGTEHSDQAQLSDYS